MDSIHTWNISGKPDGLNGTWGQIGWRDSIGNGVLDIVDTPQQIYLNPYTRVGNRINVTGTATVTPTQNRNPMGSQMNVEINKIQSVQFLLDEGEWLNASIMPTTVRKLLKYPSTYFDKQTYAIVNFAFSTPELTPGNHLIQIRATNRWGISGYANQTVTIPEMTHDIAITGMPPYRTIVPNRTMTSINVTIANQGDFQETFTIIASYNSTAFASQMITVGNGSSVKWLVIWNTTGVNLGNYIITTIAGQLPGETDTADNQLFLSDAGLNTWGHQRRRQSGHEGRVQSGSGVSSHTRTA